MDPRHVRHRRLASGDASVPLRHGAGEDGFSVIQWVFMISLVMVLLAMVANVIALQYGGGAVRAAVDEGARVGAFLDGGRDQCEEHAMRVLRGDGGLLRGTLGDSLTVQCTPDGSVMRAIATGTFEWWLGGLPDVDFTIIGEAIIEEAP